jgi:hypothetical protein
LVQPIVSIFNEQVVLGLLDPLVGKPTGNRRVSKPRHRFQYKNKIDPKETKKG